MTETGGLWYGPPLQKLERASLMDTRQAADALIAQRLKSLLAELENQPLTQQYIICRCFGPADLAGRFVGCLRSEDAGARPLYMGYSLRLARYVEDVFPHVVPYFKPWLRSVRPQKGGT